MSSALPKEQQSAYQRWELASFGDERGTERYAGGAARQGASGVAPSAARAEEMLAEARDRARQEGYAEGLEQGRRVAIEQARILAEQEQSQLQQLAASFGAEIAQASENVAQDLLSLALDLSKAMLRTALAVRPELVLPVVGEAVHYLPSLQLPATLHLHADDAALVRARMGDELTNAGWRILDDAQTQRGGCRIETASNQIDATIQTRWQRIATALGKDADWLA